MTSDKLPDSPSKFPCIQLWMTRRIWHCIKSHLRPYSTHPFNYCSRQDSTILWTNNSVGFEFSVYDPCSHLSSYVQQRSEIFRPEQVLNPDLCNACKNAHHLLAYYRPTKRPARLWHDSLIFRPLHWHCRGQGTSPIWAWIFQAFCPPPKVPIITVGNVH